MSVLERSFSEMSFSERKYSLLVKGDIADVELFVGSVSSVETHRIYASKVHLSSVSEYFKKQIADSKEKSGKFIKVCLPPTEPEIVRRIVEFAFLGGKTLSEVENVEQCVDLIVASKRFKLEELGQFYKHVLLDKFLTVHSFWPIFDAFHENHHLVHEATQEFLVENSEAVLKNVALHKVRPEALSVFLQDPNLHIDSEMKLVKACINYAFATAAGEGDARSIFRRVALPHLRLYNLEKGEDAAELKAFLTENEYLCVAVNMVPGGFDRILEEAMYKLFYPVEFCTKKVPRKQMNRPTKVHFLPSHPVSACHYYYLSQKSWYENLVMGTAETKFVLSFEAPRDMTIVELQTLHPIRINHFNFTDVHKCTFLNPVESRWLLPSSVTIGTENTQFELAETEKHNLLLTWATWKTSTEVKQGSQVKIEICFDEPCLFRKAALQIDKNRAGEGIPFRFKMSEKKTKNDEWLDVMDREINIFKSFSFFKV
ncbi:Hypothetical predicted protein [Cloeon dipterum]|uniref:BTB domain-containing protein n=1 Tax=Cloeon dipterum TaxID=197152 RepID=A0A8S1E6A8_9INSE|nr:Hypothetical predicted protein [Cloeon dipterum]